jgi:predicted lipid-binding transport protein (Tim44 family)
VSASERSAGSMVAQAAAATPRAAAAPRAGATATPRTKAAAGRGWRALRGTLWGTFWGLALGRALGGALGRGLALLLALLAGHFWEKVSKPKEKFKSNELKCQANMSGFDWFLTLKQTTLEQDLILEFGKQ